MTISFMLCNLKFVLTTLSEKLLPFHQYSVTYLKLFLTGRGDIKILVLLFFCYQLVLPKSFCCYHNFPYTFLCLWKKTIVYHFWTFISRDLLSILSSHRFLSHPLGILFLDFHFGTALSISSFLYMTRLTIEFVDHL